MIIEPDEGISDAFNKGLAMATGDYINFPRGGRFTNRADYFKSTFCWGAQTLTWCARACFALKKMELLLFGHRHDILQNLMFVHCYSKWHYHIKRCLPIGVFLNVMACLIKRSGLRWTINFIASLSSISPKQCSVIKSLLVGARAESGPIGSMIFFDEYHAIKCKHRVASTWILRIIDWFTRSKYKMKTQLGWLINGCVSNFKLYIQKQFCFGFSLRLMQAILFQLHKNFFQRF